MAGKRQGAQSRLAILQAAARVIEVAGASHLTLDAVAHEAGISNGGLLYHFPSKEALLEGMLGRVVERSLQFRAEAREAAPHSTLLQRLLQARLRLYADVDDSVLLAILAAAAERPALLDGVRPEIAAALAGVQDEHADAVGALIVWLASEGLALYERLDLAAFDPALRNAIEVRLQTMAAQLAAGAGSDPEA